jgi:hypothetical protein
MGWRGSPVVAVCTDSMYCGIVVSSSRRIVLLRDRNENARPFSTFARPVIPPASTDELARVLDCPPGES